MTPQEFVTRVYNVQEGVIMDDLWPTDDKYREVLYQANLVIDDFQKQEDWSWLRKGIILGPTTPIRPHKVPKYELPKDVIRVSTNFNDSIKLHKFSGYCCDPCGHEHYELVEDKFIEVPFTSKGRTPDRGFMEYAAPLEARTYGRYIEFTRCPIGPELGRVAVVDCQIKIPHLHICTDKCKVGKDPKRPISYEPDDYNPCKHIEDHIFDDFYEDYMIIKTAYNTAKYSPIAGGIRPELNDQAQKLLSKIRQLDAAKTRPDIVKRKFNYKVRQVW